MAKVKVYNQEGKSTAEIELPADIFEVALNEGLLHQVVVALEANSRQVLAHTKDRSEVRGGGRKPWKQKGTGRARHGSIRSPIWKGGGVTFGPQKIRNFTKKLNKQVKRKALAMTLSDKVSNNNFIAIESLALPEVKTKNMVALLNVFTLSGKKILVVIDDAQKDVARATQNIPNVSSISPMSLNVIDVLKNDTILISKEAVEVLTKTYGRKE